MSVICQRGWESWRIFPGAKAEIWKNRHKRPLRALEMKISPSSVAGWWGDSLWTRIHPEYMADRLLRKAIALLCKEPSLSENILLIRWKFQGWEGNPLSQILQRETLKSDINAPALYSYLLNSELWSCWVHHILQRHISRWTHTGFKKKKFRANDKTFPINTGSSG